MLIRVMHFTISLKLSYEDEKLIISIFMYICVYVILFSYLSEKKYAYLDKVGKTV